MQAALIDHNSHNVVWQPFPDTSQEIALDSRAHHTLYHGTRGPGKMQPIDEPVLTHQGWVAIGLLKRGSIVLTPKGIRAHVTHKFNHLNRDVYKITFDDGSSTRAGDEHLWKFKIVGYQRKAYESNWHYDDTMEMKRHLDAGRAVLIPTILPAKIRSHSRRKNGYKINPYLLGLLLGDGSFSTQTYNSRGQKLCAVRFCTNDLQLAEVVKQFGFEHTSDNDYSLYPRNSNGVWEELTKLKLHTTKADTKFVPKQYLSGTIEIRLAVLQGLMDTDGTTDQDGHISFTSVSKQLAKDVQYLAWSLGAKATLNGPHESWCNGERKKDHYDVSIQPASKFVPFRLWRKVERINGYMHADLCRRVSSIEYLGKMDTCCILIDDEEHLYITKDFIVTHNSDVQLMRFRRRVGLGYGSHWRGVIFDREYKPLDDLITKSKRWFNRFNDGAQWHASTASYKWTWPTGEELLFRRIKKLDDYEDYHGQEYAFIGWNELTKFASPELYDMMMSCNRSGFDSIKDTPHEIKDGKIVYLTPDGQPLPPIPLEVFSTTNPRGPGHQWVKTRFIDVAKNGQIVRTSISVLDPKTREQTEVVRTQVAIFGHYSENPALDKVYIAGLSMDKDENRKKAWLNGDWNAGGGDAFDDLWDETIHVIPRFPIPEEWHIERSFDWGSSQPFSVGMWAIANGEEIKLPICKVCGEQQFRHLVLQKDHEFDPKIFCPAAGSIIRFGEWYGSEKIGTNKGIKLSSTNVAIGIKQRESELIAKGWIAAELWAGPADNSIRDVRDGIGDKAEETIEKKMSDQGVRWLPSDKSPGSRRNGFQLFRDMLEAALPGGEGPAFYVMDNCRAWIATVPSLPRDPEDQDDVDSDAEDHTWDETRFEVLKGSKRMARKLPSTFVH